MEDTANNIIGHGIEIRTNVNRLESRTRISNINKTGKILYLWVGVGIVYLQGEKHGLAAGHVEMIWDLLAICELRVKLLYFVLVRPFLQYCVHYVWHILNGTVTNWQTYQKGFPG